MTLWRMPVKGDLIRNKSTGSAFTAGMGGYVAFDRYWEMKENYEFVSVTPIEPPPEPLRRTVYVPVFKGGNGLFSLVDTRYTVPMDGEEAKRRTAAFEHRVGIIKVELVEGQYDE